MLLFEHRHMHALKTMKTMKTIKTMKKSHLLGATFAFLLASASSSHAVAVTVNNFSFENPGGDSGYPSATSWSGSNYTEISSDIGLTGGTGARYGGQNSGNTMTQALGAQYLANTTYTLTVALANRTS